MTTKIVTIAVLAAVTAAALSAGILLIVERGGEDSPGVEIFLPTATPAPELKVYISGAVAEPGVYSMRPGDRLADALAVAGGTLDVALLSCVNLAVRVLDEAHYHVPDSDEPCETGGLSTTAQVHAEGIDLNSATLDELETLPGIGPTKAKAIVDYRKQIGGFKSIEQVMDVAGIGAATYEGIRDLVYVEPQAPSPVSPPTERVPRPSSAPRDAGTSDPLRAKGVDLNSATLDELETLPGIGPVKAQAIVDYREQDGGFDSVEQVMDVVGIGSAAYENIRDLVYVEAEVP